MANKMVVYILAAALTFAPSAFGAEQDNEPSPKIELQINYLDTIVDDGVRAEVAAKLTHDIQALKEAHRTDEIDQRAISKITTLLSDRSDAVRSEAAAMLGLIGPNARSSIPALHRALKRIQDKKRRIANGTEFAIVVSDSESSIRLALRRVRGISDNLDQ